MNRKESFFDGSLMRIFFEDSSVQLLGRISLRNLVAVDLVAKGVCFPGQLNGRILGKLPRKASINCDLLRLFWFCLYLLLLLLASWLENLILSWRGSLASDTVHEATEFGGFMARRGVMEYIYKTMTIHYDPLEFVQHMIC